MLGPRRRLRRAGAARGDDRTATVRASGEVEALRLEPAVFRALTRAHPEVREYFERSGRQRRLRDFFSVHSRFAQLPADALALLLRELERVDVAAGEMVLREGDPPGPMYVVEDGRLPRYRARTSARGDCRSCARGDFFGERSLMLGEDRSATVEAVSDCTLLRAQPGAPSGACSTSHPEFRRADRGAHRRSTTTARVARVPLDFAEEILPAEVGAPEIVAPEQVEQPSRGAATRTAADDVGAAPKQRPSAGSRTSARWTRWTAAPRAVAMVCRHFGRPVSLAHIRHVVHTATDGTSLVGITRGAEELGLAARAVKASKSRLDELPLPAIVHWEGNHWVVALRRRRRARARLATPRRGLRRDAARGVRGALDRLRGAARATRERSRTRRCSGRDVGWIWAVLPPATAARCWSRVAARAGRGGAAAGDPDLEQVDRRQRPRRARTTGCSDPGRRRSSPCCSADDRDDARPALHPRRVAVRIDAATLDFLTGRLLALPMSYFNDAADRRHRAAPRRHAPGPRSSSSRAAWPR